MILNFVSILFNQPHTSVFYWFILEENEKLKKIYLRRTDIIQNSGGVTKSLASYVAIFTIYNSVSSAYSVCICLMKEMRAYYYADYQIHVQ